MALLRTTQDDMIQCKTAKEQAEQQVEVIDSEISKLKHDRDQHKRKATVAQKETQKVRTSLT